MKPKTITKRAMVRELAKKVQIDPVEASFHFDTLMHIMYNNLREGVGLVLPHIGSLKVAETKAMQSHLTGQFIPPHKRLKFRVNVKLARYVRVATREHPISAPKK
jgi:nucleoid DNA-binding protein